MDPIVTALYDSLPDDERDDIDYLFAAALAEPTARGALTQEVLDLEALAVAEPHVVHQESVFSVDATPVKTFDPTRAGKRRKPDGTDPEQNDAPFWLIASQTRTYVGATDCPDCHRGLSSRGASLVCPHLPRAPKACHPGCIVACGRVR